MPHEHVDIVRLAETAFNSGDDQALASLAHPEIEWDTGLIGTPTYRGREGLVAMLRDVRKAWTTMTMEIVDEPSDTGAAVVFEARLTARGRTTGAPVTATQHFVVEFRDGLARRTRVFSRRQEALEATRPRE